MEYKVTKEKYHYEFSSWEEMTRCLSFMEDTSFTDVKMHCDYDQATNAKTWFVTIKTRKENAIYRK